MRRFARLRAKLADQASVPAYAIFTNATLLEIAVRRPATTEELMQINGVGTVKCARYGKAFLDCIRAHILGNSPA